MRALVTEGVLDGLPVVADRPDPTPGPNEVLVRVRAAGLNNGDLVQVMGGYPAPPGSPPDILGIELAGEVIALGLGAHRFKLGDHVMAVVGGGGQAELAVVHERCAMPCPDSLDWAAAGGFPETFTTAHDALFTQAGLRMGERVCISGAAGGVGTAAVQLASAAGAQVVATVRDPSKRAAVAALGSRVVVIDPSDLFSGGPFDVILELIGAPNIIDDLRSLAPGGRISVIGISGGAEANVNLGELMGRRAQLFGSTLRHRPLEQKADAARRVEAQVLPLVALGEITVPIVETFPLEEARDAYRRFAEGGKLGKVVITVNE